MMPVVDPVVEPSAVDEVALLTRPALRPNHVVPAHGVTRSQALAEGLAAPWRVHSEIADPARLRSTLVQESFSLHVLTDGERWSVVALGNPAWHTSSDKAGSRTDLLVEALEFAPVEGSVSGLIQRYADPMGDAPVPRRLTMCRSAVCADAVGLLLKVDYPEVEEDTFLLALGGNLQAVQDRRNTAALSRFERTILEGQVDVMLRDLKARGVYREQWAGYKMRADIQQIIRDHWNPETLTVDPAYRAHMDARLYKFFGNALDE